MDQAATSYRADQRVWYVVIRLSIASFTASKPTQYLKAMLTEGFGI
jgi:hypothetical protein